MVRRGAPWIHGTLPGALRVSGCGMDEVLWNRAGKRMVARARVAWKRTGDS